MSPEDDADHAATRWLLREHGGLSGVEHLTPSLAGLLRRYGQEQRDAERVASFHLFNDAMNEFVANMKIDQPMARETMKRRMLDAVKAKP